MFQLIMYICVCTNGEEEEEWRGINMHKRNGGKGWNVV